MAAVIRQEINILDHNIAAAASDTTSNEIAQLDTTQYNGTVAYYFEALCSKTAGDSVTIALRRSGTTTDDATIASASIGTSLGLVRSAAFTPPAGATSYRVFVDYTSGTGAVVKAARIVVTQSATTLTNTETQIEIGNYNLTRTTESAAILTNPKYWKYDASKWDGTKTFYAEAVYDSGDMDTISVYLYTTSDILAPSWSSAATIVNAATTTTPTRTRVAFTPVDGNWYTIFSLNGSMDNHDIYRAGIVVDQSGTSGTQESQSTGTSSFGNVRGDGGSLEQAAQSFTTDTTYLITSMTVSMGDFGSPTDEVYVKITSTLGGAAIATSDNVSGITGGQADRTFVFTGSNRGILTSGNTYYLEINRTGANDASNFYVVYTSNTDVFTGERFVKSSGSWGAGIANQDVRFTITGEATPFPTKLEPQYLLANTLFAAGTALQTFLTDWDSTEWDDGAGSIAYYFQAEAANGSTSDVTLEEADGGGTVTNSTLTDIDNAQISSAMTMPADQNLDTKATTNAGDVAAARILVTYVFSAAPPAPVVDPYNGNQFFQLLGSGV